MIIGKRTKKISFFLSLFDILQSSYERTFFSFNMAVVVGIEDFSSKKCQKIRQFSVEKAFLAKFLRRMLALVSNFAAAKYIILMQTRFTGEKAKLKDK